MKTTLLTIIIGIASLCTYAADLLVEEFGLSPAYSSISAAVAAANDGDRIIIKNRTGNIPWVEDITIAKSIELLSYINDSFFVVQGNYTITPASGRTVTIIGMRNLSGGISASTNGSGTRTRINIYDSYLTAGNLTFDFNALDVRIVGNQLSSGYVSLRYGMVVGNDISYGSSVACITVNTDGAASDDYVRIIGNRVTATYSTSTASGNSAISWSSSSQFFEIKNNFAQAEVSAININTAKNSNAKINTIYNNSVKTNSGSFTSSYSIYCLFIASIGSSSIVEVMNNLIDHNASASSPIYYGIYSGTASGQRNVYYNVIDNNALLDVQVGGSWTVNTNNVTNQAVTVGSTGVPSGGADTDAGNPAAPFYDIDLTPNNAGCFGGSFTHSNFFPLFTGAARVWFADYPFNIRQGNTLSIQAESFDR